MRKKKKIVRKTVKRVRIRKAKKSSKRPPVRRAGKLVRRAVAHKSIISESAVLRLIEKGRQRGFVTNAEVLGAFPTIEKDIGGLEALYERLESLNINVIESARVFEEKVEKPKPEK